MPTYDYRCEANGQVYEVRHAMALRPKTWGELRAAGALAEDSNIPDDAPVTKLMTAAGVVNSRVLSSAADMDAASLGWKTAKPFPRDFPGCFVSNASPA